MSAASRAASVAAHYNQRQQGSASDRKRSEVFHLRQFNNWVKATLLAHYGGKVRVHTWAGAGKHAVTVNALVFGAGATWCKWGGVCA